MVDTNNVFGFNCREKLHENDVLQSFFSFIFMMLSYQKKIRQLFGGPGRLPPDWNQSMRRFAARACSGAVQRLPTPQIR
jgi:hypothetical protein